ncbi:MAG: alpha/beta hydrolase [Fusobacteriaceae bacterium]|jgi:acetyl esterase/lipase|nr:alpha/beta hydrolase [Fusobacteriaceae bacterium]
MNKKPYYFVVLSLIFCLISMIATNLIHTDFGNAKREKARIVSRTGHILSIDMLIPKTATAKTPAPTIIVAHGGNNIKEMMSSFKIEYVRRGYVVMAIDLYSHGESESLPQSQWLDGGRGMYDAVQYALTIPFVDKENIALVGFSRGGAASNESIQIDNKSEKHVIKAAYLVNSDAVYKNKEGAYIDIYGSRDVGINADTFDEFFFTEKNVAATTYSNDANRYVRPQTSPVDYVINNSAQSFLSFGEDPTAQTEKRKAETVYTKTYSDGEGSRIINVVKLVHIQGIHSKQVVGNTLKFFERVMPTTLNKDASDQIWPTNSRFGLLGLIGLCMFVVSSVWQLARSKPFASLDQGGPATMGSTPDTTGKIWFWGSQLATILFATFSLVYYTKLGFNTYRNSFFLSSNGFYYGLWGATVGAFGLLLCFICYQCYGKKNGFDLKACGLVTSWGNIVKSILVAIIVAIGTYLIVFAAQYIFKTEFIWFKWIACAFGAEKIPQMLKYLPFYVVFYLCISISTNCFNYNGVIGKSKWINLIVLAILNTLPPVIIMSYQYITFARSGLNAMIGGNASTGNNMITLIPVIFVATIINRKIYDRTKNPYLAAITTALVLTIQSGIINETIPVIAKAVQ